ncbi:rare lipoprotein A [Rippkaea orientalis PCC 8801]|uniref:Probable endolytic peptidoglycan transglycosylase RlpA n=1 Tax=Rippkaea orientalis (strain PCC 8801 / RF-1) TaxID=41431 RepID=B7K112_RIPO1|nr:septal ring lytic transglycosylase RlpA family protein [Rippkaea orientalis]ACK65153.1 rare lipoprotein A [Rippkaea orientalis PCC 8801]
MNKKLWSGLTTTALTTALGTSVLLCGSFNGSVASEMKDKADDLGKLLGVTTTANTESSEQLTALAPKVVSLGQVDLPQEKQDPEKGNIQGAFLGNTGENLLVEPEKPLSAIATLHPHQWKYRLAITLRVREIPVLTFVGSQADLAQLRNNQNNPDAPQKDSEVMKKAKALAQRLNELAQDDTFEAQTITVSEIQKNKTYGIKIDGKELVRVDGQTILPDTTNNLAADALQVTNRLRRLMGGASPLTAINQVPDGLAGVEGRVTSTRKGMASWYGPGFHGRRTANGERYNQNGLTAAHKTLPFGTQVKVTNLNNGRSITVRINDRGPYAHGRIIDLSKGAAQILGLVSSGVAPVQIEILGR